MLVQWASVRLAVLVPVKRFTAAKRRLTGVLDDRQRAQLAEWMAAGVLDAVASLPTFVACDDDGVAEWAGARGARVSWGAGRGLNGAVDDGVSNIRDAGFDHVLVAHADLARPDALIDVAEPGTITLVPDRHLDGTNVMSFPLSHPLRAAYGGGSFVRHLEQALRHRVPTKVHADEELALDLDTEDDLHHSLIREVLPSWLPTSPANH